MSAETLRRAAALMRERADVGGPNNSPSPWSVSLDDHVHNTYEVLCHADGSGLVTDGLDRDMAQHVASWHPAVALAVADWLDYMAAGWREPFLGPGTHWGDQDRALAVAVAYLGEAS